MDFDPKDLFLLSLVPGIGPTRLRALVNHFSDPADVIRSPARQLIAVQGIERRTASSIAMFFRSHAAKDARRYTEDQFARLKRVNGRIITLWDHEYPLFLKKIYDPPPFLFVRGQLTDDGGFSVAIVGTRTPSAYGLHMAQLISSGLAQAGIAIVSGLARGIDTCAHTSALDASGRTVAVIGSGLDIVYPAENKRLSERIVGQGAVVSEYPLGTKPDAGNFPRRNRIISGASLATVVIETGVDGGAMITASTALDQNRQVFAIPSSVAEKRRSGTNMLIKQGRAMLVESCDDIINDLAPQFSRPVGAAKPPNHPPPPYLTLFEQRLMDTLTREPVHVDLLAERTGMSTSDTLVHLLSLEFKGAVRQLPGKLFVRL